ncbi:hypothetical protein DER44DRAFT_743509 [Fusarium oxysporum]|nr:hypothetical protein DER44DRAFT_743509 [Fusarium oxysporum]
MLIAHFPCMAFAFFVSSMQLSGPSFQHDRGRVILNSEKKNGMSEMKRWVNRVAPDGNHTCISFQSSFQRPGGLDETWDHCHQDRQQGLESAIRPRRVHFIGPDFKTAEKIVDAGRPHLITSNTRRRLIFDLETRQPVTVTTQCSNSEEKQQMSWVHRFSRESTNIYTQPGFCYGAGHRRHMRVRDEQLGGFLTALSEFGKWPLGISNVVRLFDSRGEESQVATDIGQRLTRQGILKHDAKSTTTWSLALPKETRQAFYRVIPLVGYDHRLALFLSIKSKNPMVNTAKAQMAATISGSSTNCFDFVGKTAPEVHETSDAARIGLFKHVAHTSTVMKGLGLIKTAITASRFSMILPEIYLVDKQIRVSMNEVKHAMELCRMLLEVPNTHGDIFITDLVSQIRLEASFEVRHSLEWPVIPKNKKDYAMGIYTRATRERGRTTIQDWNWIPRKVWDRWGAELPGGIEGLRTKFKLTKNHDEVVNDS